MERIALKRMPADALPIGDVFDLLDAAGNQLEIQVLQKNQKRVTKRRMKKSARHLVTAIDRLTEWPEETRLRVAAELVSALRAVELDSIADNLLVALQQADSSAFAEHEAQPPQPEISALERTRAIVDRGRWTEELEPILRQLREHHLENPDDEDLLETLKRGVLFNAVSGREHLLLEERRRQAEAEPLPEDLAKAFDELPDEIIDSELLRLGLHLVLADVVAADLVPPKTPEKMTVAAALVAMLRLDEPGKKPDIDPLGSWANSMSLKIDVMSDDIAKVFKWTPPGEEVSAGHRQEKRWKVHSLMYQFLPARWVPGRGQERPPYNEDAARQRLEELRDLAWLMIDEIEAVRFVSEAFRYGEGGADSMGIALVHDVIELWEGQTLVRATEEFGRAYLEDEWHHEIPDDEIDDDARVILPAATTSDGEPLVLSTVIFDVAEGAQAEIAELIDATDGFRQQAGAEGERWDWYGPSTASKAVIADVSLDQDELTVVAHSLNRASRANAALVDLLGERIVLRDIRTEQPTQDALAELGIAMVGEEGTESADDEQVRVVHEVLEKHYRKWFDEPLSDLDERTPRDAAADEKLRTEVIRLLLEAEERTRTSSWPMSAFDFDFIWTELGLSRAEVS